MIQKVVLYYIDQSVSVDTMHNIALDTIVTCTTLRHTLAFSGSCSSDSGTCRPSKKETCIYSFLYKTSSVQYNACLLYQGLRSRGTWGHRCTFCKNYPPPPHLGFLEAFGDHSWPPLFELWEIPGHIMTLKVCIWPQFSIFGCFRSHPRPLILKPSATPVLYWSWW